MHSLRDVCVTCTPKHRETHFLSRSHGFLFISYTEMAKITIANTETNFCICLFPFFFKLISSLRAKETGKLYSLLAFMLQHSIAIFCRSYNINTVRANIYILLYKIKTNGTFQCWNNKINSFSVRHTMLLFFVLNDISIFDIQCESGNCCN